MNTSKKISVVLATYNGDMFLSQQLESLLSQTYQNIEIIAVDDCSSDNTLAILDEFARNNNNIKVYKNETNLGFIKNFERGCSLASGELIAPCDQDDFWEADKLSLLAEAIGGYPLIYHDSWLCDEALRKTGKRISDIVVCQTFHSCLQYAVFARIYGHTLLFTKDLLACSIPFIDVIPHDWWLAYNATLQGGVKFLPKPLVYYRQHDKNVFGIIGQKSKKDPLGNEKLNTLKEKRTGQTAKRTYTDVEKVRIRIKRFYDMCPESMVKEKQVLGKLVRCYQSFSIANNFRRTILFFKYQKLFLAVKKQSLLHKYLFCFKMFVKIK